MKHPAPENGRTTILIGEWTVRQSLNRIDRDGVSVHLEPKLMDLLVCLAGSAGEVVSKEELLDRVWKVENISDSTLSHAIADLRRTLGDDARHPRYIETIFKRGYRLVAQVEQNRQHETSPAARRMLPPPQIVRGGIALGLVALIGLALWFVIFRNRTVPPRPPRIVILPFENFGGEEYDNFAAGITDELISRLAVVNGLRVISATTAFNYDSHGKSATDVGRDLDVDYIVEGSVRWSSDHEPPIIRVTPQLINTVDDSHLWSSRFDRRPADVLDVQSEIAREIVSHLELRLAGAENLIVTTPPTNDPVAYQAYLKALDHRNSADSGGILTAAQMYRRAVEADPLFAQAWAGLAEANGALYHLGFDRDPERCETARSALDRARELAPEGPETMRAAAFFEYHCNGDARAARAAFERALEKWPGDALALRGNAYACRRMGAWRDAERYFRRALELDPRNPTVLWTFGRNLCFEHRYEEALAVADRAVEAGPDHRSCHFARCVALWLGWGDTRRVAEVLERAPGPRDAIWHDFAFINACYADDYRSASRIALESPGGPSSRYQRCLAAELLGAPEAGDICMDAVEHYRGLCDQEPEYLWPRLLLARASSMAGLHAEAQSKAAEAVALRSFETDATGHTEAMFVQAQVEGRAGNIEVAVAMAEQLLDTPSELSPARLCIDPEWASIRQHPRIQEIIRAADLAAPVHGCPPRETSG